MGEIKVKAHFVKNLVPNATTKNRAIQDSALPGKISEKALKGQSLSHQTVLVLHRDPYLILMKFTDNGIVLEQQNLWATTQYRVVITLIQQRSLLLPTYSNTGRGVSQIPLGYSLTLTQLSCT